MKILLTGSSGFLGCQIIKNLQDHRFTTIGKSRAEIIADLAVNIPDIDFADLVIHAAGKAHSVPKTTGQEQEFYDINVTGTFNLLKGLEHARALPFFFVFISSVAVYGTETGTNIMENAAVNAKDAYGSSKIEAEKIVIEWCVKNKVICTILRLPLIAGPNPQGNLKSMIKGIKKGYYFNIAGGNAKKSMVMAKDVAKIIPIAANIGGIYNLTDGYNPSFSELSEVIAKQLGKSKPPNIPVWVARFLAKIGDIIGPQAPINSKKLIKIMSDLTFDDSKARNLLGWKPTSVVEGFKIV